MENYHFAQPQHLPLPLPGFFLFFDEPGKYPIQDIVINIHEKSGYIHLSIKNRAAMIIARLSSKVPQPGHGFMGALTRTTGVRVVNKMPFSGFFYLPNQQMMDYSILKISREYLPDGGVAYNKTNRATRIITPAPQFLLQLHQVILPVPFEIQGVHRIPLVLPTLQISVINIVEVEG